MVLPFLLIGGAVVGIIVVMIFGFVILTNPVTLGIIVAGIAAVAYFKFHGKSEKTLSGRRR